MTPTSRAIDASSSRRAATLRSRLAGEDRGAAAVEFAIIMLPLMLLVFGIIGYGYMLSFRQALSQAAAEGARAAAVTPAGLTDAERQTRALDAVNRAVGYGVDCTTTGMTCTVAFDTTCGLHGCVSVSLDYAYRDHPLIPTFVLVPDTLGYTASAEVS